MGEENSYSGLIISTLFAILLLIISNTSVVKLWLSNQFVITVFITFIITVFITSFILILLFLFVLAIIRSRNEQKTKFEVLGKGMIDIDKSIKNLKLEVEDKFKISDRLNKLEAAILWQKKIR